MVIRCDPARFTMQAQARPRENRVMKKDSTEPLHFVLLEDDPNDAELIQLQLAKDRAAVPLTRDYITDFDRARPPVAVAAE